MTTRTVDSIDREVVGLSEELRRAELHGDFVDAAKIATAIDELLDLRFELAAQDM